MLKKTSWFGNCFSPVLIGAHFSWQNTSKYSAIETLIYHYLSKERILHCFNEQFVSNITGDVIFSTRCLEGFGNKHLVKDLPTHVKHRTFPRSKK